MKYWTIADTHFGHEAMKKMCGRPDNFEDKILMAILILVKKTDILIHLGDFCWGNDAEWHSLFMRNCNAKKKWLIRGNHDKKTNSWYLNHGWDFVSERIDLKIFGKHIILTHKPVYYFESLTDSINIHGHQHNTKHHPELKEDPNHRLLFIEDGCKYGSQYSPVSLRSIVECNK